MISIYNRLVEEHTTSQNIDTPAYELFDGWELVEVKDKFYIRLPRGPFLSIRMLMKIENDNSRKNDNSGKLEK